MFHCLYAHHRKGLRPPQPCWAQYSRTSSWTCPSTRRALNIGPLRPQGPAPFMMLLEDPIQGLDSLDLAASFVREPLTGLSELEGATFDGRNGQCILLGGISIAILLRLWLAQHRCTFSRSPRSNQKLEKTSNKPRTQSR